jgi:hypothetical protein
VQDVSSLDIRCGKGASTAYAPSILSVSAGSTLGWRVDTSIIHSGPTIGYLAKVPAGRTAANWDGSGAVWFKVYEVGPTFTPSSIDFPFFGMLCSLPLSVSKITLSALPTSPSSSSTDAY